MPLTEADVACWLLKSAGRPEGLSVCAGEGVVLRRCLRRSYRLGLMRPGQPSLLWISGRDEPGVAAVGWLTSAVDGEFGVEVALSVLPEVVPRGDLLQDGRFRTAEVVRMAAGSNPSYLGAHQLAAVVERLGPTAPDGWPVPRS